MTKMLMHMNFSVLLYLTFLSHEHTIPEIPSTKRSLWRYHQQFSIVFWNIL